jgi:RNA polymerase sigma factor (sigma-70 family)
VPHPVRHRFRSAREPFRVCRDSLIVNTKSIDSRPDELLAIRCQLGEREAFDALIARWHEPVWRYLRRLSNSDDAAADLTQDTWLRVLRGIASLREPARLRPWLFGIARRVAMDRLRRQYTQAVDHEAVLEELPGLDEDAGIEADLAALETSLDSLPWRERETLALFYLRELTIDQIASLLTVPAGTVKSRLFRARRLLRQQLTGAQP